MREQKYIKNILFTALMALICLIVLIINTFFPDILLPYLSLPLMVLFVAISEILAFYLKLRDDGCIYISAIFGGFTLSLLPFAVGMIETKSLFLFMVVGIVTYAVVDYIYLYMIKRMKSGNSSILAPLVNGLLLFLASQGLQGLI